MRQTCQGGWGARPTPCSGFWVGRKGLSEAAPPWNSLVHAYLPQDVFYNNKLSTRYSIEF